MICRPKGKGFLYISGSWLALTVGAQLCGVWDMNTVATLRYDEAVRFDVERLEALCRDHGEDAAEKVIARALEQIAIKMAALEVLFAEQSYAGMDQICASLTRIAGQIGITTMARVARDVRACVKKGDVVGIAATMGRLHRIGDNSVQAIWSVEDISV